MTKGAQTQTCPFLDKQQNQEQSKPQLESCRALQPRHFASREPLRARKPTHCIVASLDRKAKARPSNQLETSLL